MGLTIHYSIAVVGPKPPEEIKALVITAHRRAHALVRRRGLEAIGPVATVTPADRPGWREPPQEGWCFYVNPGPGCESATFGLTRSTSRFRRHPEQPARWIVHGCCKTQYASLHGEENFLRCHLAIIDLIRIWERLGCSVRIKDEGDYWPKRDVPTLLRECGFLNAAIAGFAGAMKDAAGEAGSAIQAPVFAHPQFERLEAEAVARHGDLFETLSNEVRQLTDF